MQIRSSGWFVLALVAGGCDYSGDFLFAEDVGIEDIYVLTGPDGEQIVPADVSSFEELQAATMYAEVAAPLTTAPGGVTFDFLGTGGDVCVWVDPEIAFWSQSVAARPDPTGEKWSYPDNVFDDGDIDLFAGLSVYYTGSPGTEVGDFVVKYEDSLGNAVPISLAACPNTEGLNGEPATGGRGAPEYCTIPATDLGISYTVLLRTWSTPLDDDRLGFGVIIANGSCSALQGYAGSSFVYQDECVIQGEAITPDGTDRGPFYGFDALNDAGRIWGRSIDFEAAFCDSDPEARMRKFCKDEVDFMEEAGQQCEWNDSPTADTRCYCGDPIDTPEGGAI